MDNKPQASTYWAAGPTDDCAAEVIDRCNAYWTFCTSRGWFTMWRRLYYTYNPNRYTNGQTMLAGESGEYRTMKTNHFRNILEHVQNLSITDRPAWQPQAVNADARSQKQCVIAEGILDYYMRQKRVERYLRDATRLSLLFGEGFITQLWDTSKGDIVSATFEGEEERVVRAGDIIYSSHEPVDVVRDVNLKNFHQRAWLVVRTYENKWDVAAQYPELADDITKIPADINAKNHYIGGSLLDRQTDSDVIPILNFFHTKTPACPEGRQMRLLTDGTVLEDGILPYRAMPVYRIAPGDQVGVAMGQSVSFDLLPLQEMLDGHMSIILSVNENFSIPKVLMPVGAQIQADQMGAGFQQINYAGDKKPELMQMPTADQGLYAAVNTFIQQMETLSGVNSVSRGQPEASLQSGSALALVQSMAIQFNAPLQQAYIQLLEDVGTGCINLLQDFATTERMIQIAGKRQKGIVQQAFTADDLDSIARVQVQAGNPLSKTVSGRLSIAQDLLANQIVKTPQEYLSVLQTGELEPLTQGASAELLNLATENELLQDGKEVPVLFTDNHVLHLQEHTALASDPIVRQSPELFQVIATHIQEHIAALSDPVYQNYRGLLGYPSVPPAGAPAGPMPAPGMAPGGPQPPVSPGNQMGAQDIQAKAASVQPPQSPVNPATGTRPPLAEGV